MPFEIKYIKQIEMIIFVYKNYAGKPETRDTKQLLRGGTIKKYNNPFFYFVKILLTDVIYLFVIYV